MGSSVKRRTVDLSGYPDLVAIYLGMRVNAWYGPIGFQRFAPEVAARGPMFGARRRAGRGGESAAPAPVEEGSLGAG
jgi:hypothetical protein